MRRTIFLTLAIAAVILSVQSSQATANPDKQITPCVYVKGNVHNPGSYRWHQGMTVADAIGAANGFTQSAVHRIIILHSDLSQNVFKWSSSPDMMNKIPVLREGDTLFVSDPKRIL